MRSHALHRIPRPDATHKAKVGDLKKPGEDVD